VEVVVQKVEGAFADQRVDQGLGHGIRVVFVVSVAYQAVVGVDLDYQVLVYIVHAHAAGVVVVARGQGHGDGYLFDVGDFHKIFYPFEKDAGIFAVAGISGAERSNIPTCKVACQGGSHGARVPGAWHPEAGAY